MADEATERDDVSTILLDQTDRLLQQHVTKELLGTADRGEWPAALWREVQTAGLPLAMVPEEAGGIGTSPSDALRLIRRTAYHCLPLPLAETVAALALWAEAGGEVPSGPVTFAPTNLADRITIGRSGKGWVLEGLARRVPWGAQAEHMLVVATGPDDCKLLALVPRGAANIIARRNVAYEPRETVQFNGLAVADDLVRPAPAAAQGDGVLVIGAQLRTQQMVGAMERALDYALDYANERVQFGRPIAKFQAIQHMLAVAAGHVAAATAAADSAIEAYGQQDAWVAVAIAKARAGEAAGEIATIAHQVHAAMGFTQEHPLHYATRRLWSWRDEFGHESYWQERLGRFVCAQGGEALWPQLTQT